MCTRISRIVTPCQCELEERQGGPRWISMLLRTFSLTPCNGHYAFSTRPVPSWKCRSQAQKTMVTLTFRPTRWTPFPVQCRTRPPPPPVGGAFAPSLVLMLWILLPWSGSLPPYALSRWKRLLWNSRLHLLTVAAFRRPQASIRTCKESMVGHGLFSLEASGTNGFPSILLRLGSQLGNY